MSPDSRQTDVGLSLSFRVNQGALGLDRLKTAHDCDWVHLDQVLPAEGYGPRVVHPPGNSRTESRFEVTQNMRRDYAHCRGMVDH
jgi:hypothetical protein